MSTRLRSLAVTILLGGFWAAAEPHYVGPETCALCHKQIADAQAKTAMARTWRGRAFPAGSEMSLPVDSVVGGERHGLGFLMRIDQVDGLKLERPALVQGRYFWNVRDQKFVLAPGLSSGQPQSFENALGLVLSPSFAARCLTCHGEPNTLGAGKQGGVRCESCHGPGSEHVAAIGHGQTATGIVNPKKLSAAKSIQICAQCHAGFGQRIDPSAEDLLIANQVQALRASECFVQSSGAFACTSCHDPHRDSANNDATTTRTCLGCHSEQLTRSAAICPVNASAGCIGCHMPSVDVGPLHLVDHEIRVHPEQKVSAAVRDESLESRWQPVWEFLRVIKTDQRATIVEAQRRLKTGESFYDVARALSADASASIGGFWGKREVKKLEPDLIPVVSNLHYGDLSRITFAGGYWYLIQRMPRDFRWTAEQLDNEAEGLAERGDLAEGLEKAGKALRVYPYFLRALRFSGTTLARGGDLQGAERVLQVTTRFYPTDPDSLFALGIVLGQLNRTQEEMDTYRRVVLIEPDFVVAYRKLGEMLEAKGDSASAISILHQGLQIDPLSADLCKALSTSLAHQGNTEEAARYAALAARLGVPDSSTK